MRPVEKTRQVNLSEADIRHLRKLLEDAIPSIDVSDPYFAEIKKEYASLLLRLTLSGMKDNRGYMQGYEDGVDDAMNTVLRGTCGR